MTSEFIELDELSVKNSHESNNHFEIEDRIAAILNSVNDLSVVSTELSKHCTDWQTYYNLSPLRTNLLRPYQHLLKGDILEIAAGCGILTRYIAEIGGNITALEANQHRASIARSRTRDLSNVNIICEEFENFQCSQLFDVITLIGVLNKTQTCKNRLGDPVIQILERAKRFLKKDGVLIIAIDNQLGLKYFAGVPENSSNKSYFGIEDHFTGSSSITFGKKDFENQLKNVGFAHIEFAYPFPDYRFATSVLMSEAFNIDKSFNAGILATLSASHDHQISSSPLFSLEKSWNVIEKNKLLADLSNSFLIFASQQSGNINLSPKNALAFYFSTNKRKPEFYKQTTFIYDNKKVLVMKEKLKACDEKTYKNGKYQHKINNEDYIFGELLLERFINLIIKPNWHIQDVSDFIISYLDYFKIISSCEFYIADIHTKISGKYLDLIPANIVINNNDAPFAIDQEWLILDDIELGYLIFRSLYTCCAYTKTFGSPQNNDWLRQEKFFLEAFINAGLDITTKELQYYFQLENEFCQFTCVDFINSTYESWANHQYKSLPNIDVTLMLEKLHELNHLESRANHYECENRQLHSLIAENNNQIAALKKNILDIYSSHSWRATKWLRVLFGFIRKVKSRH